MSRELRELPDGERSHAIGILIGLMGIVAVFVALVAGFARHQVIQTLAVGLVVGTVLFSIGAWYIERAIRQRKLWRQEQGL